MEGLFDAVCLDRRWCHVAMSVGCGAYVNAVLRGDFSSDDPNKPLCGGKQRRWAKGMDADV